MAFTVGDIEGRLTLDRTPYTEGLRVAREQADRFEANKIEGHVDVDTAKADAEIAATATELERLDHTTARPNVRVDTRDGRHQIGLLAASIIALGPAAIAAGGIAAGALAPVTLAVAGVAALAIPLIRDLSKGKGPAEAVQSFQALKQAWEALQQAVQPAMVQALTAAFQAAATGLQTAAPFIEGSARIAADFFRGLQPLIPQFNHALTQMLPIVQLVERGVLGLFQALAHWTTTAGFQQFIAYIVKNGPLLAQTFMQLVRLLVQLGVAAAPMLPVMLRLTTAFAQLLTLLLKIPGVGPALVTMAALSVTVVKLAQAAEFLQGRWLLVATRFPALAGIFATVGRAAMLAFANPVGLAIAAVVVATILIIKHWDQVKRALAAVWNFLKGLASTAFGLIRKAAEYGLLGPVFLIIARWDQVKGALAATWNAIRSAAQTAFNAIKNAITGPLEAAWNWVKGLPAKFFDAGRKMVTSLVDGIKSVALAPVNAVKSVIGKARDLLPFSEPKDATSPLHGLSRSGEAIVKNLLTGFNRAAPGLRVAMQTALGRNLLIPQLAAGKNIGWAGPAGSGVTGSTFYGETHNNIAIHQHGAHRQSGKQTAMDLMDEFSRRKIWRQK